MDFFKKAFLELKHIVWPTKKETRTYMYYTISIITVMTLFLAGIGYLFRTGLQTAKQAINPTTENIAETIQATQDAAAESATQTNMANFFSGATITTNTENTESTPTVETTTETTTTEIQLPSEAEENTNTEN